MLSKTLTAGLAAVALAAVSSVAVSAPASAASITFTFGPNMTTYGTYHGHRHAKICRTKYEWHHHHKVPVGKVCHWK
jgi:hypothetical protein